jgi:hypothetical protein
VAAFSGVGLLTGSSALAAVAHPGMLHTQADLDRMRARVSAGAEPWASGWNKVINNSHAQSSWTPRATATITRAGTGANYAQAARPCQRRTSPPI